MRYGDCRQLNKNSSTKVLSIARLQRTKELLDGYIRTGKIPSYACLISQNQSEVTYISAGYRDVERAKTVERDTLYRIYSMTKPVTSIAMMQLFEQGYFLLDDPVSKYIPAWDSMQVFVQGNADKYTVSEPKREMTIKDLMMHTSGLSYGFEQDHPVDVLYHRHQLNQLRDGGDLEHKINLLAKMPLLFSPGDSWKYSVATDVLGYIIEKISGQSLDKYFQNHIFTPLGMTDTAFQVGEGKLDRLSACYEYSEQKQGRLAFTLQDDSVNSSYAQTPAFLSGGAGLVTTIDDYHTFASMLLGKGALPDKPVSRVLGAKTIEYMTQNHLLDNADMHSMRLQGFNEAPEQGVGFGLGFSVVVDEAKSNVMKSTGAFGWGGLASTNFWVDPAENICVTFMTQLIPSDTYRLRNELQNTIYQALC